MLRAAHEYYEHSLMNSQCSGCGREDIKGAFIVILYMFRRSVIPQLSDARLPQSMNCGSDTARGELRIEDELAPKRFHRILSARALCWRVGCCPRQS